MSLLAPESIAVVGASATPGKVGHEIFKNLISEGYAGNVIPINPKPDPILGHATVASLRDIDAPVDLAIIVTPAPTVADIVRDCVAKKIPSVIVISAGFAEGGDAEGIAREKEIIEIAQQGNIQLIGPNCLGLVRPSLRINASFAAALPPHGTVGIVSQSGAMGVALMDAASASGLGMSLVLSVGNKAVLDESDYLELLEHDDATRVIGMYLESVRDGRRFLQVAQRVVQKKPIVILKAGTSQAGMRAAASHTGALAGSDAAIDALCSQTGIRRAKDSAAFLDQLCTLSQQPALATRRIAIVTNAGGPGILATDAADAAGLQVTTLSNDTTATLANVLPAAASTHNPVDVLGDAGTDRYATALRACADDPNVDGCVVLLTPQVMTPCEDIAQCIIDTFRSRPLLPVTTAWMGDERVHAARDLLRAAHIPTFETPERAVHAMATLLPPPTPRPLAAQSDMRGIRANDILDTDDTTLDEETTAALLDLYHLPMPAQKCAQSADEAVRIAAEIGTPVILKISSPDILHKTDVGGVRINLTTEEEIRDAYERIRHDVQSRAPDANIRGVLVQQFFPAGTEYIVGALRDDAFGPLVMTGLGGIYTELFRDTAFRIAPIDEEEAYAMLASLRSWRLLHGMRGKASGDIDALAQCIAQISALIAECPRIRELDINPVLVHSEGITIADAKVLLSPRDSRTDSTYHGHPIKRQRL